MAANKFKIKVLCRNPDDYVRETKRDLHKMPRNHDPKLHPFEGAREYQRALNATKMDRMFAKPFICGMAGHRDSVQCMSKHPTNLSTLVSGSCDGEIRLWNLPLQKCIRSMTAHSGFVRGTTFSSKGEHLFSVGNDKTIKQWKIPNEVLLGFGEETQERSEEPVHTILGDKIYTGIDHSWGQDLYATCGEQLDLWEVGRSESLRSLTWGTATHNCVKFNPIETNIIAGTSSDRGVTLYDLRSAQPLQRLVLKLASNSIAWNPMEAFHFSVANEDYNVYTFDMRRMKEAKVVHMDHVGAVMDVDYSPTGKSIVSGSYDRAVRIFDVDKTRSREIYHTKRMQKVFCVRWSLDNKYLLSGSDETIVRLWKANASEKLGTLTSREKDAFKYSEKLKDKFAHHPQVRKIARHRHVPGRLKHLEAEKKEMIHSRKRKEANRRAHSKPGSVPIVPETEKNIVRVDK